MLGKGKLRHSPPKAAGEESRASGRALHGFQIAEEAVERQGPWRVARAEAGLVGSRLQRKKGRRVSELSLSKSMQDHEYTLKIWRAGEVEFL